MEKMNTEPQVYAIENEWTQMDCEALVDLAFSGLFGIGPVPSQVTDMRNLRLQAILQGHHTVELDNKLKALLLQQLEVLKVYEQVWHSDDPEPELVAKAWVQQDESMERWELFVRAFECNKNVEDALRLAFQLHQYQPPLFSTEEERHTWLILLKNQQQRFLGKKPKAKVDIKSHALSLRNNRLYYQGKSIKLEPRLTSLMELLIEGEPQQRKVLLLQLYGHRSIDAHNTIKLSREVHHLNQKLEKLFGPAPIGRWIGRYTVATATSFPLPPPLSQFQIPLQPPPTPPTLMPNILHTLYNLILKIKLQLYCLFPNKAQLFLNNPSLYKYRL